jgi:hypothetical protein
MIAQNINNQSVNTNEVGQIREDFRRRDYRADLKRYLSVFEAKKGAGGMGRACQEGSARDTANW